MQHSSEWHDTRRKGLGGSDIAAVLGLSKWRTPMDVWAEKRGLLESLDENYAMMRGRILESAVSNWYQEQIEGVVEEGENMPISGPEPWMLASPDRYVKTDSERFGLEIKTARSSDGWGPDGGVEIPIYYATQVAWYMACTNIDRWDVAVLFMMNDEFRSYTIQRDMDVERRIIDTCRNWWNSHVLGGDPPPLDSSNGASEYLKGKYPNNDQEVRKSTPDETNLVFELYDVKEDIKRLQEKKAYLENKIKNEIGDNEGIWNDWGKITWKMSNGRSNVDIKKLRKELPKVAEAYTKTTEPSRIFRANIIER
jgi:putative phage-type endonuclease